MQHYRHYQRLVLQNFDLNLGPRGGRGNLAVSAVDSCSRGRGFNPDFRLVCGPYTRKLQCHKHLFYSAKCHKCCSKTGIWTQALTPSRPPIRNQAHQHTNTKHKTQNDLNTSRSLSGSAKCNRKVTNDFSLIDQNLEQALLCFKSRRHEQQKQILKSLTSRRTRSGKKLTKTALQKKIS